MVLNNGSPTFSSGPYTNDWFRVNGGNGIYWETYTGGWYMIDSTWMRAYNGKSIYSAATIQADGDVRAPIFYDSNNTGYYVDPNGTSVLSDIYLGSSGKRVGDLMG